MALYSKPSRLQGERIRQMRFRSQQLRQNDYGPLEKLLWNVSSCSGLGKKEHRSDSKNFRYGSSILAKKFSIELWIVRTAGMHQLLWPPAARGIGKNFFIMRYSWKRKPSVSFNSMNILLVGVQRHIAIEADNPFHYWQGMHHYYRYHAVPFSPPLFLEEKVFFCCWVW